MRISSGSVEIDTTGKKAGRGAYLCQTHECWEAGVGGGRLEYALQTSLTQDNREQLIGYEKDLMESISEKD